MGGGASRRYKYGLVPEKYFKTKIMPEMYETFGILDFNYNHAFTLFKAFIQIDYSNQGSVSVLDFHTFLGLKPTKFSERVFGILDLDASGDLDFSEFVIGIWNFCTYDALLLTKFSFDIFDIDNIGKLSLPECEALIRMVYDSNTADTTILSKIAVDTSGDITIDEFALLIKRQPQILQPAFDMQRVLRMKCFGIKYWEAQTEKRKVYFGSFDSLANSSWESMQKILKTREAGRKEQTRKEEEVENQIEKGKVDEINEKKNSIIKVKSKRFTEVEEKKATNELPEERIEKEWWTAFTEIKDILDKPCERERLGWKIGQRQELWSVLDKLSSLHRATICAQEQRDMLLADGPDGDAKAAAFLTTKRGKKKLRFDKIEIYSKSVFDAWSKGNNVQRLLAPMFEPEMPGQVTFLGALVATYGITNRKGLKEAGVAAREKTVARFHENEKEFVGDKYKDLRENSYEDFELLGKELVETGGTRASKWEVIFDKKKKQEGNFLCRWTDGFECKEGSAICHVCDELIEVRDFKCFNCDTLRSPMNQKKYAGKTPLSMLMILSVEEEEVEKREVRPNPNDYDASKDVKAKGGDSLGNRLLAKGRVGLAKVAPEVSKAIVRGKRRSRESFDKMKSIRDSY